MDDLNDLFDKIESSPLRKETTFVVLGDESHALALMLAQELANRRRGLRGEQRFPLTLNLAAPIPKITISEAVIEPDAVIAGGGFSLRALPADSAAFEARTEKPVKASWKEDTLGRQVSDYGPPTRKASILRNLSKKGRK